MSKPVTAPPRNRRQPASAVRFLREVLQQNADPRALLLRLAEKQAA